jgi:alkyl hydroperoxide reductase subunit F
MLDAIIIGAGPAGMAAAVYLARQKMDFIIVSKNIGGQTVYSSEISNYLGFLLISGNDLVEKFKKHIHDYDLKVQDQEEVTKIEKAGSGFRVVSDKGEYEAKTVLIATGEKHRRLDVPGEEEFRGKGVTYCATCDAPLFADKDIAVGKRLTGTHFPRVEVLRRF